MLCGEPDGELAIAGWLLASRTKRNAKFGFCSVGPLGYWSLGMSQRFPWDEVMFPAATMVTPLPPGDDEPESGLGLNPLHALLLVQIVEQPQSSD